MFYFIQQQRDGCWRWRLGYGKPYWLFMSKTSIPKSNRDSYMPRGAMAFSNKCIKLCISKMDIFLMLIGNFILRIYCDLKPELHPTFLALKTMGACSSVKYEIAKLFVVHSDQVDKSSYASQRSRWPCWEIKGRKDWVIVVNSSCNLKWIEIDFCYPGPEWMRLIIFPNFTSFYFFYFFLFLKHPAYWDVNRRDY